MTSFERTQKIIAEDALNDDDPVEKEIEKVMDEASLMRMIEREVLDRERKNILRFNYIKTHDAPGEYEELAKKLLEILKKENAYLTISYGPSGYAEYNTEEEDKILRDRMSELPEVNIIKSGYFNYSDHTCAHGAFLEDDAVEKVSTLFDYSTKIVDPKKDDHSVVAKLLWEHLNLYDGHRHIECCLKALGLDIPEPFLVSE